MPGILGTPCAPGLFVLLPREKESSMFHISWPQLTRRPAKRRSPDTRNALRGSLCRRLEIEFLEDRLIPAAHIWTGVTNNLWSISTNWTGGAPTAAEQNITLSFPSAALNTTNTNDIAGLTILSLTLSANNYSISGNSITLSAGMTADAGVTGTDSLNLNIALGAPQTWTVTNAGATLAVGGVVSGVAAAGLTVAGPGTLVLSGNNTY